MNRKIIYSSIFSLKDSHHSPFYFILHYYLCRDTNSVYGIVMIFQNQDFLGCSSTNYGADHYRTARNQFHHILLFICLLELYSMDRNQIEHLHAEILSQCLFRNCAILTLENRDFPRSNDDILGSTLSFLIPP